MKVAPYVGAWIETVQRTEQILALVLSHPTWVRGLKRWSCRKKRIVSGSHPTWVRGLKHPNC